jgi:hypothetical protein
MTSEPPQDINTNVAHPRASTTTGWEEAGIRQILDLGTGIPTSPNVHEIAQAAAPETRVVDVDNDPIVLAHARALPPSQEVGRRPSSRPTCASPSRSRTTRP